MPHRLLTSSTDKLEVKFEKDKLKGVTSKQSTSYQLEVINNGKLGSARSNQLDSDKLLEKAMASSEFGDEVSYDYPKPEKLPNVKLFSPAVTKITPQYLIELGQELVKSLKEADPKILVTVYLDVVKYLEKVETSAGFSEESEGTSFSVYIEGELVGEGDILNIGDQHSFRDNNFDKDSFINNLKEKFRLSKDIVSIPTGQYTVIFAPEIFSSLLNFIDTALNGDEVYKKVSKWASEMGKQVTDPRFTLSDNPLIDFALGSARFDDEGHALSKLSLVEKGVLKNFYTDLKNASKLGIASSGRGFGLPATPSLTNIVVEGGTVKSEDMIKGIKRGLLIDQAIGAGQDNPYAGDFSFSVHLGYLIEDGKLVGRVKDTMISGNIFEMLKDKIDQISQDRILYGGSQLLPHISFLETTVVSK